MRIFSACFGIGVSSVLLAGCVTAANDPVADSVYTTHRIVRNIERDLAPRVSQLNETSADLLARVEESDTQVRRLQTVVEENQVKLDSLQARLDEIAQVLYRYLNVAPPSGSFVSPSIAGGVDVVGEPEILPPGDLTEPSATLTPSTPSGPAPSPPPVVPPVATSNAVADYNEALRSLNSTDYEKALEQFGRFVEQYPNNDYTHRAQFWKGECHFRLKQYNQAITEYERLRADFPHSPKCPTSMYQQAVAHSRLEQRDKMVTLLTELVEKYPADDPAVERARTALSKMDQQ